MTPDGVEGDSEQPVDRPPGVDDAEAVADDAMLAEYASVLADAVDEALPGWVVGHVERLLGAWHGGTATLDPDVQAEAEAAGREARAVVGAKVRRLLETDIDEQRTTPLALLRGAVSFPTEVLRRQGVPAVVRDEFDERSFPDDVYGLSPVSFADIHPALGEAGLAWGAAKAHTHLRRRRRRERT